MPFKLLGHFQSKACLKTGKVARNWQNNQEIEIWAKYQKLRNVFWLRKWDPMQLYACDYRTEIFVP